MNLNALPSEQAAVVAVIDPDVTAAGAVSSAYVDMRNFGTLMAIALAGTLGSSATFDFKLQQATAADGTGVKDITGKAITQLTEAGTDSDKQAVINLRAGELDVKNGFRFVNAVLTIAVATSDAGAVLIGMNPRRAPASDSDLASVDEIVN